MEIIYSVHGVPIRLTDERWAHITEEHTELAGLRLDVLEAVATLERILAGGTGEQLAVKTQPDGKTLVVVYREFTQDGFIITAFLTRRLNTLDRRRQLWP